MIIINGQGDIENFDISSIQNVEELKIINVPKIPEGKFHGLNKLTKVYMNNINIIESGAFMDCKNLKEISFKDNPKEIHDFAFHNTKVGFIPELYENTKFGVYNNLGKNIILEDISWSNINKLSELGKCENYFNIGDTKSIIYNDEEIYNVQIIGFNHDDLVNKNGKSGVTFQFKECITGTCMNLRATNYGGWKASEMRRYLNEDIYELLSADLQAEIKEVSKVSYVKNKNIIKKVTTTDKLFLLSLEETGLSDPYNLIGQGEKYKFYSDNISRVKSYSNGNVTLWWLRSAHTYDTNSFFIINTGGSISSYYANYTLGVTPAFCI